MALQFVQWDLGVARDSRLATNEVELPHIRYELRVDVTNYVERL